MKKLLFVLLVSSLMSCQKEPLYPEPIKPTEIIFCNAQEAKTVDITINNKKISPVYQSWPRPNESQRQNVMVLNLYNVGDVIKAIFLYAPTPIDVYIDGKFVKTLPAVLNQGYVFDYVKEK